MSRPPVRLYDTFTRSRQELRPIHDGVVRIYSCGPTVYRYVHVGNLRTFMLPDLLCRSLTYLGFPTHQVMNITDVGHLTDDTFDRVEDKMLVSARLQNTSTAASTGSSSGRVRGAKDFQAGTSSAPPCRCHCSANVSTSTPEAPTTSFPTTRQRSRSPRL